MLAHGWGRGLKDVGDQALMRGLATAFPSVRPGLSLSYCGRRLGRPQNVDGGSPAVAPPPPMREGCAWSPASASQADHAGWLSRATDHMKPASSRAIAVQTMVSLLPRAARAR